MLLGLQGARMLHCLPGLHLAVHVIMFPLLRQALLADIHSVLRQERI